MNGVQAARGAEIVSAEGPADLVAFCEAEYPRLFGLLSLYCGDAGSAEEFAQEALVRAWVHWGRVSTLDNPSAWVTRVALNLANSWFRRASVRRRVAARLETLARVRPSQPDPNDALAVRAAVSRLPIRQKTALTLRYYADLPVAEVARRMGCPEGTVKTLTRDAIAALRRSGLEVTDE